MRLSALERNKHLERKKQRAALENGRHLRSSSIQPSAPFPKFALRLIVL
jgi:hypothetical protein